MLFGMKRVLRAVSLVAAGLSMGLAGPARSQTSSERDMRRDATVLAIEKVMPSVVNIATETIIHVRDPFEEFFRQFWDPYHRSQPPNSQYSLGSGVVIDEAGYILTNDHVVRRADKIAVKFSTGTNVYEASVVATDPKVDVALLKLKAPANERFTAIKFAREDDLMLGETVLALGNPFGLGGSVSRGILSSKSRQAPKEGEPLDIPNWLQTDASINLGNSGGPLVNLRGELIGINVAVLSQAQGIGFAIPVKRVTEALSQIFPTEFVKSLWFGARVKVGSNPLSVISVQPESPAGEAGIRPGDAILEVRGKQPRSFIDFADLLSANGPGEVPLLISRGSEKQKLEVKLVAESSVFNETMLRKRLGLSVEPLSQQEAARYGLNGSEGFVISGVDKSGPAAAARLQPGMLLTAIDGQTPPDVTAFARQVYSKKKGDRVSLDIAVRERVVNFMVWHQGTVELSVR